MKKKMAFCTCVQLGLSCIEEIYRIGGELDLLISLRDHKARNKSGRVYLDVFANEHHIPLLKINHINDEEVVASLREREIDWLFIIGWSQIAGAAVLDAPRDGCLGMHPTLLPKGRGRAAVPWAILKGLSETGVTLFKLDEGVDTGDIVSQGTIPLHCRMTATELYGLVNEMHVQLIRKCWDAIVDDHVVFIPQNHAEATEWPGRCPDDGRIDAEMSMQEAHTLVRAVTRPYPGAFFDVDGEKRYRIWSAAMSTENGEISLVDGYLKLDDYEVECRL